MSTTEGACFDRYLLIAVFDDKTRAERAVSRLIKDDYPADQLSLLGRGEACGDDILGIYHSSPGERMKAWGKHGALWGGLWGLIGGAAGALFVPGIGLVLLAGPIVEALAAAAAGAGAMALAALLAEALVVLHRFGVPEDVLLELEQAVKVGRYVMILQGDEASLTRVRRWLPWSGAASIMMIPGRE